MVDRQTVIPSTEKAWTRGRVLIEYKKKREEIKQLERALQLSEADKKQLILDVKTLKKELKAKLPTKEDIFPELKETKQRLAVNERQLREALIACQQAEKDLIALRNQKDKAYFEKNYKVRIFPLIERLSHLLRVNSITKIDIKDLEQLTLEYEFIDG